MNYLTGLQDLYLLIACVLLAFSYWNFTKERENASLVFLFLGALMVRFFIIQVDPYLHDWDERFHALVAKNMMQDPLKPVLVRNPVLPYNYQHWWENYVWLHKQPLFLWQMALSLKIFGVNEMAVRIPDMIMGAVQVIFIYRIGKIGINKQVGYYAALFFSFSYFQLQQSCGFIGMDHNDIAFSFYVTSGIWSFFEYQRSGNKKWLLLIGLFSGCAVLNKWLTGLLVYAGWGIGILSNKAMRGKMKSYVDVAISAGVTLLVFLPWQIYTAKVYPLESSFELSYNAAHISSAVEAHGGDALFYIRLFAREHFGFWAIIPFFAGLWYIIKKVKNGVLKSALLVYVFIIYFFFSVIVATKLTGYSFVSAPFVYLLIAAGVFQIITWISARVRRYAIWISAVLIVLCWQLNFSLQMILVSHFTAKNTEGRSNKIHNDVIYKELDSIVPPEYVIFNGIKLQNIEAMFYSDRTVYGMIPTEQQYDSLKKAGVPMACFESRWNDSLPAYMVHDEQLLMIHKELE